MPPSITRMNATGPRPPRRPTFLWQATLVVLPVAILAILGLFAVRRDYAASEQDARQRADDITRSLSTQLGRDLASELLEQERFGSIWEGMGISGGPVRWPETNALPSPPPALELYAREISEWQRENHGWRPEAALPNSVLLDTQGTLIGPRDYPATPVPAAWLDGLSAAQRSRWEAVGQAWSDNPATNARVRLNEFLATDPPASAKANAEFDLALLDLATNPPAARLESLVHLAGRFDRNEAESGLPVANLALARALQEAGTNGLTQPLFDELVRQCGSDPSVLIPRFLADAKRLAYPSEPVQSEPWRSGIEALQRRGVVADLRDRWQASERLRALTHAVQAAVPLRGIVTTNLWLDWQTNRWLAVVDPSVIYTNGDRTDSAEPVTKIRFYPKPVVQRAFARAFNKTAVTLPAYLGLAASLEGEPILNSPTAAKATPFSRAEITLALPGRLYGPNERVGDPNAGRDLEAFSSHPRLELEVYLADAALLYARARQRAWLFGGLVLAAAGTALVGLLAAHRAFARQLRLSEMKSNFVASVSHELRAPIAAVRLLAENLDRGKVTDEAKRRDYFRLIGQECRRLSALIENALDFSRIDQGRKRYEFEPTDLAELVRQTVEVMQPYAAERHVRLEFADSQLSTLNPQPDLDGRAIQQALVNLIDNAVKHSPAGETVTVSLNHQAPSINPQPSTINLSISDHGPGIPAAEHARIFEPFYRRGSELRRETPGVGIGLTIVQHVVSAHGGRVRVESEVGKGSRFIIELPVRNASNSHHG
jgi:signal transduction histidine kinase